MRFTIDEPIHSGNVILRSHYRQRKALKDIYREWIWIALHEAGYPVPEERPQTRMRLTIISYRLHELDEDNLHAGAIPLINAIKELRLIKDDSPKWIDLELRQEIRKDKYGTEIEIEETKK